LMFQNTGSKHIFKYLVDALSLAIHPRVIGQTVDQVILEGRMQLLPKASDKLQTPVGDYVFGTLCKHNTLAM
jgi:riboflavin biosynthesis pyrimidine reductase